MTTIEIQREPDEPAEATRYRITIAMAMTMVSAALEENAPDASVVVGNLAEQLTEGHEQGHVFMADLTYRMSQVEIVEPRPVD